MTPVPPSSRLRAGRDYPPTYRELRSWFPNDDACLDYLEWLRWPDGFICPKCSTPSHWRMADGRFWCECCRRRISVTTGTIFHRTRTPLTIWFVTAWNMTCSKNGVSAKTLHLFLGFGSYQTIWAMLQRFRTAMVRPDRDHLDGLIEADETYVGGVEPGVCGRKTQKKSIIAIAVELREPKGFGRVRLRKVPNVTDATLTGFVRDVVRPGCRIRTDAWKGYNSLPDHGFHREIVNHSASEIPAHITMPGVHRVAAQLKRWLTGTHQGAVEDDHLQGYLDEFAFRFNRRKSEFRGLLFRRLLEQAVQIGPITYRSIVMNPIAKKKKPQPPDKHRVAPATLAQKPVPDYPWRISHP